MSKRNNNGIIYGRVVIRPEKIKEIVKDRRESLGLSLRGLASRANVAVSTVVALEQGNHNVQLEKLLLVLAVLNLVPQDLWETTDEQINIDSLQQRLDELAEISNTSDFLISLGELFKKNGH